MLEESPEVISKLTTELVARHILSRAECVLPSRDALTRARGDLTQKMPTAGLGLDRTIKHLEDIILGFNASSRSPNYYGFVIGGVTPAASLADHITTLYDQNVQVHMPSETIATDLEDRALSLLCELLELKPSQWPHRTFTTGATASNVLGISCAREFVIASASDLREGPSSVGKIGIFGAMRHAGIDKIQILTTVPHSSLGKAASLIGLGRESVIDVGLDGASHKFDFTMLEKLLQQPNAVSIVVISAAEVNTGFFSTSGMDEMQKIRKMCDLHGAWIHVDGAFGIMARILTSSDYPAVAKGCQGLEFADSITGDAHKLLNVPYDCGFFFSRHLHIASQVFQNPNAAYLSSNSSSESILSPLNIGIENSRRLRALPVYASLIAYGRDGYRNMLERQISLARAIADYILDHTALELLPQSGSPRGERLGRIYIIVLFKAKEEKLNHELATRIKRGRKIYVSGTIWDGKPACRFAVSNWMADVKKDLPIIKSALENAIVT